MARMKGPQLLFMFLIVIAMAIGGYLLNRRRAEDKPRAGSTGSTKSPSGPGPSGSGVAPPTPHSPDRSDDARPSAGSDRDGTLEGSR
jgi:hypothetical protein